MKTIKFLQIYACMFLAIILFQNAWATDGTVMPDISGEWVSLDKNGEETEAIITISQNGKNLDGTFVDTNNGEIIIEAPLAGFIDVNGGVIFDIYFGRITSTNRLKLSSDQNMLEGKYSNNMENEGEVHLQRK